MRKTVVAAVALSVGIASAAVGTLGAYGSQPVNGGVLTVDGSGMIWFPDGSNMVLDSPGTDASWSSDGSKAVYIDQNWNVAIAAYDFGTDYQTVLNADHPSVKAHPTWGSNGSDIFWADHSDLSGPWEIAVAQNGYTGVQIVTPEDGFDYLNPDGGPNNSLVFQRQADSDGQATGQADIYGFTNYLTQSTPKLMVSNAAEPSISPDGTKLAFVRSVDGHNEIFVSDLSGDNAVAVTSNAISDTNPTWSPDGSTIAFNQGPALFVATARADGSQASAPTPIPSLPFGHPAYQPSTRERAVRLSGHDRFGTANAISQQQFPAGTAKAVVLSRSDTFADALGGSALAAEVGGPLLLTSSTSLTSVTATEIARVLGSDTSKTVYLLGGADAITPAVANAITAMGYQVQRIDGGGTTRYDTAVGIASQISTAPDVILVATGNNFPDALGAGAAAGSLDVPDGNGGTTSGLKAVVVLTNDETMPASTARYILAAQKANPKLQVFGVGSQGLDAATSLLKTGVFNVATAGPDLRANRFLTSELIALTFFGAERSTGLATAVNWPDAMAGGSFLAAEDAPMLITGPDGLDLDIAGVFDLTSPSVNTVYVFGGPDVVSPDSVDEAGSLMCGPGGFDSISVVASTGAKPLVKGATPTSPSTTANGGHRTLAQIDAALKSIQQLSTER